MFAKFIGALFEGKTFRWILSSVFTGVCSLAYLIYVWFGKVNTAVARVNELNTANTSIQKDISEIRVEIGVTKEIVQRVDSNLLLLNQQFYRDALQRRRERLNQGDGNE